MNKKRIGIGVGAAFLLGFIVVAAAGFDGELDRQPSSNSAPRESESSDDPDPSRPSTSGGGGSYVEYTPQVLQSTSPDESLVLFFHADWCPTCRALDEDITARQDDIPADVTIAKVDFDNDTELRQRYGVRLQHTLVQVDRDGEQIAKWHQSPTLEAVLERIES